MTIVDDFTVDAVRCLPEADRVQYELADIDEAFHLQFGRDESAWLPAQVAAYNRAIDAVWAAHQERAA